jgi:hypothetical protein
MKKIILLIMMSVYMFGSNGSVLLIEKGNSSVFKGTGGGLVWTFMDMESPYNVTTHKKYLKILKTPIADHSINILLFGDKVLMVNTNKGSKNVDKLLPLDKAIVGRMYYVFNTLGNKRTLSFEDTLKYRYTIHSKICSRDYIKPIISNKYAIVIVSVFKNEVIISSTDNCK